MERQLTRDLSNIKLDAYTPSRIELALRALVLAAIFAPVILLAPLALISSWFRILVWYALLRRTLGNAGVAFIKWAQWSSTRNDMFPAELCRELGQLRHSAPCHSASYSRKLVERAVGQKLEGYFEAFSERSIASGSIAQVHRATLHGLSVAVKVRHPGVVEHIATDFAIMQGLAALVSSLGLLRWFDLEETVKQFSAVIGQQTQLQTEALHLRMCIRNFAAWPDCIFPRPLLATADVIIESFEPGRHVSDFTGVCELISIFPLYLYSPVGHADIDIYLKMLLQDNLMHADLHPGNLLVRNHDGDKPAMILVDLGMVAILSKDEQRNYLGLLHAMGSGDGIFILIYFWTPPDLQPLDRENFEIEMDALFLKVCRGYGTAPDFGEVVRGVLTAVRNHRVRIGPNYMTLIINALCLDAMARTLQPSYSTLDAARPLLQFHKRVPGQVSPKEN
ncbi:ABC1 family-domain-containing protein [Pavlovales sp. CCMP2436]|nr:ABC1 family-domain-containing protein [Pavlovales sp. CCMP2436]